MSHLPSPQRRRRLPESEDGELVARDEKGRPDVYWLSSSMLHGRPGIALTLSVFDVLAVEGLARTMPPYSERRDLLKELELENDHSRLVATFEDGEALFAAVCERGLEDLVGDGGVVPFGFVADGEAVAIGPGELQSRLVTL